MKKNKSFIKRQKRNRSAVRKNLTRARLTVFRSNKHIYAQLIDDRKSSTLVSANDAKVDKKEKLSKTARAVLVGEEIATKALKKGLKDVVFDRGGYKYHGRVKALSEGARKGGLNF